MEIFTYEGFIALLQVMGIDLVLAGDNAIVIGLAAAGLPKEQRAKAILVGIAAATVMRIGFALITAQLLAVVGLLLAGGILLVHESLDQVKKPRDAWLYNPGQRRVVMAVNFHHAAIINAERFWSDRSRWS